tara:strand:- start:759 stop:1022 length:264 start_codon:yes stop_codon:yes gene_type:complete
MNTTNNANYNAVDNIVYVDPSKITTQNRVVLRMLQEEEARKDVESALAKAKAKNAKAQVNALVAKAMYADAQQRMLEAAAEMVLWDL